MAMAAKRAMGVERSSFRNAAQAATDGRAGGARKCASHQAKALRDAGWKEKVKNGEKKRKRGKGSAERRAERRRAAAADASTAEADDEADSDDDGGYTTATEGDGDVWLWGLGSWAGGAVAVEVQTQTCWMREGSQEEAGCEEAASCELPGFGSETVTEAMGIEASTQCEYHPGQDVGVQTLRRKLGGMDQMSVRLQTDFSFEEEHRKLLKREAKMQEDAEKKTRQLRKDVKEEEVTKVLASLRTTILMLNDRRNEAIRWKDDPIFPWDNVQDGQSEVEARAARVKLVEDKVGEMRVTEARLRNEINGRQGAVLPPIVWEQNDGRSDAAHQKIFTWEAVEQGFNAVQLGDHSDDTNQHETMRTRRWHEIIREKRSAVDMEWRREGKYVNQERVWSDRQLQALEAKAWRRADAEWKQDVESSMQRRIADLESQTAKIRWGNQDQGASGAISAECDGHVGALGIQWGPRSHVEWAQEQGQRWLAVKRIEFRSKIPQLHDPGVVWAALQVAKEGKRAFTQQEVCEGIFRMDYSDHSAEHFEGEGVGEDGLHEQKRAWLRREMRGIMVRSTGEIVARGLHKFFNIGQLDEIKMSKMAEGEVLEVLEKLDGQMVMGVVIDAGVEYWSRRGRTPTAVTASRVVREAVGQHDLLVQDVHNQRATAVFEMIGSQSRVKSDEGMTPQLVLIAVRAHASGEYWPHWQLKELGMMYHVNVVRRFEHLEGVGLRAVAQEVLKWKGKEGVAMRMQDSTMVKIKSQWWYDAGYCKRYRDEAKQWQQNEVERWRKMERRMQTRRYRLAVLRAHGVEKPVDILNIMRTAEKVEAVYDGMKLSVMMISFRSTEDRAVGKKTALCLNWKICDAYSNRTKKKIGRRIAVFYRDNWLCHLGNRG